MRVSFPRLASRSLPAEPRALAKAVDADIAAGRFADGYVRLSGSQGDSFLFVLQGKLHSAGALEDGRFVSRGIAEALAAPLGEAELCATDLALLLCVAVMFRKAPAVQMPVESLNAAEILSVLAQTEVDTVVAARRADLVSLLFCRSGNPVEIYAAPGEKMPDGPSIAHQLVAYARAHRDLIIDLYSDIRLAPVKDAGKPLSSYLGAAPKLNTFPSILVKLGGRVVFRYDLTSEAGTIGRGQSDLVLDNLSVSRNHARFRFTGNAMLYEDVGSENGIIQKGAKVARASVSIGEEIGIGKYTLVWGPRGMLAGAPVATGMSSGNAMHETIAVGKDTGLATVEYAGETHKIRGLVFMIGSAADSQLRIRGLFIGATHVRLHRDASGQFTATHAGGLRAMRVNGTKHKQTRIVHGDVIEIGRHRIEFRIASTAAGIGPRR